MPRASRNYIPGYVWHITHRCHKKEFLLKFARDRQRWIAWLFEARKRFGLSILNYTVTSNHIHLLVRDNSARDIIPKSIQLVAGRTAQEFNLRKARKGAFWEDRYHATAVETDKHLRQCLVYIDLNMVRAGAVKHPADWPFCGYNEIQRPRVRYRIIDHEGLQEAFGCKSIKELKEAHKYWIEESLKAGKNVRERMWTESVAVGCREFVEQTKKQLGSRAIGRKVLETGSSHQLREMQLPYNGNFEFENGILSFQNAYFWESFS